MIKTMPFCAWGSRPFLPFFYTIHMKGLVVPTTIVPLHCHLAGSFYHIYISPSFQPTQLSAFYIRHLWYVYVLFSCICGPLFPGATFSSHSAAGRFVQENKAFPNCSKFSWNIGRTNLCQIWKKLFKLLFKKGQK